MDSIFQNTCLDRLNDHLHYIVNTFINALHCVSLSLHAGLEALYPSLGLMRISSLFTPFFALYYVFFYSLESLKMEHNPFDILHIESRVELVDSKTKLSSYSNFRIASYAMIAISIGLLYTSLQALFTFGLLVAIEHCIVHTTMENVYDHLWNILETIPNMLLHALSDAQEFEHAAFPWHHNHHHHHHAHAPLRAKVLVMASTFMATKHELIDRGHLEKDENFKCCIFDNNQLHK